MFMRVVPSLLLAAVFLSSPFITDSPGLRSIQGAAAQIPEPDNVTLPGVPQYSDYIHIVAEPQQTALTVREGEIAEFTILVRDMSLEGATFLPAIPVNCQAVQNTTDVQNWGFQRRGAPVVANGETHIVRVIVSAGLRPQPEFYTVDVTCRGGGALSNRVIGEFSLTAQVEDYTYMGLNMVGAPPRVRPEGQFTQIIQISNNGLRDKLFQGRVSTPEGWRVIYPDHVFVPAGEIVQFEVTGVAPRGKIWYSYETEIFQVAYWPVDNPDAALNRLFTAQVHGFYFHPALIPLTFLGIAALILLFLLILYARRSLEEQVLGKPIPPWRIPLEREFLARLKEENPDEYYVVRYYLMVEEHASALLWYKHFKHATRKDRRHERLWLRRKRKTDRRTGELRRRRARLEDCLLQVEKGPAARARLRLARLEKRNLARAWREQRRLLALHRKGVRRVAKIHARRVKAAEKILHKENQRALKALAKENRRRMKQGDEPLPAPEAKELQHQEPEFPGVVEVPILAVAESSLAVRHARLERRIGRELQKAQRRAARARARKGAAMEARIERLESRLPPEPETSLYDEGEFVPEDEVVVVRPRNAMAKLLRFPSLEERERLRRRREVMKARLKVARGRGDKQEVQAIKRAWKDGRRSHGAAPVAIAQSTGSGGAGEQGRNE